MQVCKTTLCSPLIELHAYFFHVEPQLQALFSIFLAHRVFLETDLGNHARRDGLAASLALSARGPALAGLRRRRGALEHHAVGELGGAGPHLGYAQPRDEAHVLAEATLRVPRGIVCLVSALQFHGLTLQMPSTVWMAIERTDRRPKFDHPSVRFVRFSGAALTEGVTRHRIDGIDVAITDPARTVVDCFRYRAKMGSDIAMEGLREGLRQRRFTPDELWKYAQSSRAWSVMRPYVEAMASDGG